MLLTASSYTAVRLNAQYFKKKKKKSLSLYYGSWTSTSLHLTFISTYMLKYLDKLPGFVSLASLLRAMLRVGCLLCFTTRHCLSRLPAPLSSCQTQFTCFLLLGHHLSRSATGLPLCHYCCLVLANIWYNPTSELPWGFLTAKLLHQPWIYYQNSLKRWLFVDISFPKIQIYHFYKLVYLFAN